jgi:hypothetical protein
MSCPFDWCEPIALVIDRVPNGMQGSPGIGAPVVVQSLDAGAVLERNLQRDGESQQSVAREIPHQRLEVGVGRLDSDYGDPLSMHRTCCERDRPAVGPDIVEDLALLEGAKPLEHRRLLRTSEASQLLLRSRRDREAAIDLGFDPWPALEDGRLLAGRKRPQRLDERLDDLCRRRGLNRVRVDIRGRRAPLIQTQALLHRR